jgi:hypothetical protein
MGVNRPGTAPANPGQFKIEDTLVRKEAPADMALLRNIAAVVNA